MPQWQRIGKALCTGLPTQVLPGTSHAFSSGAGLPGRPQAEIGRRVVAVEAGRERRPGTADPAAVLHATGPLRLGSAVAAGSGGLCAESALPRRWRCPSPRGRPTQPGRRQAGFGHRLGGGYEDETPPHLALAEHPTGTLRCRAAEPPPLFSGSFIAFPPSSDCGREQGALGKCQARLPALVDGGPPKQPRV